MSYVVRSDIPYANVCDVEVREGYPQTRISFTAGPHGGPEALWFCFRIRRQGGKFRPGRQIKLILKHCNTLLGGGQPDNILPVVRYAGGDWQRLGGAEFELRPDRHTFAWWTIDAPAIV